MLDRSYFEKDTIGCDDEDGKGYSALSYHNIIMAFVVVAVGVVASAVVLASEWSFSRTVVRTTDSKYRCRN